MLMMTAVSNAKLSLKLTSSSGKSKSMKPAKLTQSESLVEKPEQLERLKRLLVLMLWEKTKKELQFPTTITK